MEVLQCPIAPGGTFHNCWRVGNIEPSLSEKNTEFQPQLLNRSLFGVEQNLQSEDEETTLWKARWHPVSSPFAVQESLVREGFGSFCSHEVVQRIHVDVEVDAAHPLQYPPSIMQHCSQSQWAGAKRSGSG